MRFRLPVSFYDLKDSLWIWPAVMTVGAMVFSLLTVQLDLYLFDNGRVQLPLLFEGGAEGARGVLGAIAGTMMTVATTAFSVTLVALQLGSSQFSPRIFRSFTGDRANQLILGTFIATFAYSLSVLRTVKSESQDASSFVPTISVTIALALAFISLGSLIYFFHHATRSIQAWVVVNRTYEDTMSLVKAKAKSAESDHHRLLQEVPHAHTQRRKLALVHANSAGYVQDLNAGGITGFANQRNVLVELHTRVGDYVNPGTPIATVWEAEGDPQDAPEDQAEAGDALRAYVETGLERTLEHDALYGMQQLTDIALLALSPARNDPTTALGVVDRLGTVLIEAQPIAGTRIIGTDDDGEVRLIYPVPDFEDYARLPFDQLRTYAISDPNVTGYILRTLANVSRLVSTPNAMIISRIAREYESAAANHHRVEADLQRMQAATAWAHDAGDDAGSPTSTGRP